MRSYIPESNVSFVEANGLRFGYLADGEGPLVLLLHGFPDTPHTWDDARRALAGAGFRAVSPFMRGYAPTTIPDKDVYTNRHMGEDVLALIAALGHDSAILVGHDWGAVAVYSATHLGPERVEKLVTVAIPHPRTLSPSLGALWRVRHFFAFKLPGAPRRFARDDFRHVDELYKRWSPKWDVPAAELEPVKNAFAAPGCASAALGYYRCLRFRPDSFMKDRIAAPTLVFAGLDDELLAPEVYDKGQWMFSGDYQVARLPGGHFLHRESSEAFVAALLAFVKGKGKGSGS